MRSAGQGRRADPGFEVEAAGAVTENICSIGWVGREAMMMAALASAMAALGKEKNREQAPAAQSAPGAKVPIVPRGQR
jgi:hypothetical protein